MSAPNFADPRNVISTKDSLATWMAFMGMFTESADTYASRSDWAKAPADEAFVYAAIRLRSLAASSVPLRVYVRDGHNLIPSDQANDRAAIELQTLLDYVNPDTMSSSDMKATLLASLSIYGEAYLVKTRGRLGGTPRELYFLSPAVTAPVLGERWIEAYDYRPLQRVDAQRYPARDVVPFRAPGNFMDPTRGLSPLSAIRLDISTSKMATEHTNSQLKNQGVPPGVWVAPKDTEVTEQDKSAIKRVLASLRGPKNAGRTAVLPGGLEWKTLGLSEQDAQYLAARKVSRMAIAAAFGIPLQLLGDDEHTGVYRSVRDAEQVFWRRLATELGWVASVFDSWLVPDFDPTQRRLCVRFDLSQVEALRPTLAEETQFWMTLLDRGVVVPNEARKHFGLGDPTEWGDKPTRNTWIAPVDEQSGVMVPPPEPAPADPETAASLALPRELYRHPAVKAFLAGDPLDLVAIVGSEPDAGAREAIETGLRRRYKADQIVSGVPAEGFPGLAGVTA